MRVSQEKVNIIMYAMFSMTTAFERKVLIKHVLSALTISFGFMTVWGLTVPYTSVFLTVSYNLVK